MSDGAEKCLSKILQYLQGYPPILYNTGHLIQASTSGLHLNSGESRRVTIQQRLLTARAMRPREQLPAEAVDATL